MSDRGAPTRAGRAGASTGGRAHGLHDRSEAGIAAMWLMIGMSIFFAFAAMSVDIGLWYVARTEVQTATDAAALAGAALLPGDEDAAIAQAKLVARQHGYDDSDVTATVVDGSLIEVEITADVENFFLPAIGFAATQSITADATAEYEGQVNMGSPENIIGNDPESSATQPDFVLGVEGPGHTKINGDRFLPKACGSSSVSYCTSSATIQNDEFDENGYFFAVEVEATHGQDLVFQVFDPAFVAVWNASWQTSGEWLDTSCLLTNPSTAQSDALEALTASSAYSGFGGGTIPQGWYNSTTALSTVEASNRYVSGRNRWCLGDSASNSSSNVIDTAFMVRSPDETPWNPLDNRILTQASCQPAMFEGFGLDRTSGSGTSSSLPSAYELLDPTNTTFRGAMQWEVDLTDTTWTLAESWRRWVSICRVPAAYVETGKYLVQVRTTASVANPLAYDPAKNEPGLNAFALRAGFDNGTATPQTYNDIRVYAEGNLPIFANADSANPTFHLARVLEVGRDRTLTIELYDAGDAGSSGSIQVLPPADSNMSTFTGCQFDLEGSGSPSGAVANQCKVTGVSSSAGYNGKVMLIQVPIPSTYTCDETSDTGCWVKLQMGFNDVHDFTTWSAYISGDPVRLIE